jgi:hypothetical protein
MFEGAQAAGRPRDMQVPGRAAGRCTACRSCVRRDLEVEFARLDSRASTKGIPTQSPGPTGQESGWGELESDASHVLVY